MQPTTALLNAPLSQKGPPPPWLSTLYISNSLAAPHTQGLLLAARPLSISCCCCCKTPALSSRIRTTRCRRLTADTRHRTTPAARAGQGVTRRPLICAACFVVIDVTPRRGGARSACKRKKEREKKKNTFETHERTSYNSAKNVEAFLPPRPPKREIS